MSRFKLMATLLIIMLSSNLLAQDSEEYLSSRDFSELSKFSLGVQGFEVTLGTIYYNEEFSKVINLKRFELSEDDPFYAIEPKFKANELVLIRTKLDGNESEYYVISYDEPLCDETSFNIYGESNPDKRVGWIGAEKICIPGDGHIYSEARMGCDFDTRSIFHMEEDSLVEVKQPYFYVGLKSKCRKPITLYKNMESDEIIGILPKDCEVEVLLSNNEKNKKNEIAYLVKTPLGIVGWIRLVSYLCPGLDIVELCYRGS